MNNEKATLVLSALRAQDDLERLRWMRDNSYPDDIGNINEDFPQIADRNKDVFGENDSWGWIIVKMETHARNLREEALEPEEEESA